MITIRVGQGYDIHPLRRGRKLILGGIEIPYTHGLDGHSDADALTHAVCDALLGSMGEGDLGRWYPSSNADLKNISSLFMLQQIGQTLAQKGFTLVNVDTVILAESPKLAPYLEKMGQNMAEALKVAAGQVNVKVKSGEGLGLIGRGDGIAAQAICLIQTKPLP